MVTETWLVVKAVDVDGSKPKLASCPLYEKVSLLLLAKFLVIIKPVGSKYSPTVYVVFVGAVWTAIVLNVGVESVTVTVHEPDFVVSTAEVAVIVQLPAPMAVRTPLLLTLATLELDDDQVTD